MLTPFDAWATGLALTRLGIETQAVLWLRGMGAAGAWNTPFDEGWRALREKPPAFAEALDRAATASSRGAAPAHALTAAADTLARHVRDNRHRLEGRGRRRWQA